MKSYDVSFKVEPFFSLVIYCRQVGVLLRAATVLLSPITKDRASSEGGRVKAV